MSFNTVLSDPLWFEGLVFSSSLVAGILGAILGLGGGMMMVPLLTLAFGVKMHYAVGASIVSVMATSTGAAVPNRCGTMNLRLGVFLALAGSIGGWAGAMLTSSIGAKYLFLIFFILIVVSIPLLVGEPKGKDPVKNSGSLGDYLNLHGTYRESGNGSYQSYSVVNAVPGFVMMTFIGTLTGMLGVGCGALRMPVMDRTMRVPFKVSASTSNFMLGITSAVSALTLLLKGYILPFLAAPVGLGVLLGARLGVKLLEVLPEPVIRRVFILVMLVLAIQMGARTIHLFVG